MAPFVGRRMERAQVKMAVNSAALSKARQRAHFHYCGAVAAGKTSLADEIGAWVDSTERANRLELDLSDPYNFDPILKLKLLRACVLKALPDVDLAAFDFLFLMYDLQFRDGVFTAKGLPESKFSPKDVMHEGLTDALKDGTGAVVEILKKAGAPIIFAGGALSAAAIAQAATILSHALVTGAVTVGAVTALTAAKILVSGAFHRARRERIFRDHPDLAKLASAKLDAEEALRLLPELMARAIVKVQAQTGSVVCLSLDPAESFKSNDEDHGIGHIAKVVSTLIRGIHKSILITTSRTRFSAWKAGLHAQPLLGRDDAVVHDLPPLSLTEVKDWLEENGIAPEAPLASLFGPGGSSVAPVEFMAWWSSRGNQLGASAV